MNNRVKVCIKNDPLVHTKIVAVFLLIIFLTFSNIRFILFQLHSMSDDNQPSIIYTQLSKLKENFATNRVAPSSTQPTPLAYSGDYSYSENIE